MITCDGFLDGFSDYLDGDLSAQSAEAFDHHLESCEDCQRYHEVMVRSLALVRALDPPNPSELFHDRLNARLYVEEERSRATGPVGSGASSGTMVLMTVLFAAAAWSPALGKDSLELVPVGPPVAASELAGVLSGTPLVESAGLGAFSAGQITLYQAEELEEDLWSYPNAVFFEYSSLSKRGRVGSSGDIVRSVGLQ